MANGVLAGLNRILESQETREQTKLRTSLALMQYTQQMRMQDIALTKANLDLVSQSIQQSKPQIASEFMDSSGLSQFYIPSEEGEESRESISEMASNLRHKKYFGKKISILKAESIASAVWSYYEAKDPTAIINLANELNSSINAVIEGGTNDQKQLYEAFSKIGNQAALFDIVARAQKVKISEENIEREKAEFLIGDYNITREIGTYPLIEETADEAPVDDNKIPERLISSRTDIENELTLYRDDLTKLQKKKDDEGLNVEEEERLIRLPELIDDADMRLGNVNNIVSDINHGKESPDTDEELPSTTSEQRRAFLGLEDVDSGADEIINALAALDTESASKEEGWKSLDPSWYMSIGKYLTDVGSIKKGAILETTVTPSLLNNMKQDKIKKAIVSSSYIYTPESRSTILELIDEFKSYGGTEKDLPWVGTWYTKLKKAESKGLVE